MCVVLCFNVNLACLKRFLATQTTDTSEKLPREELSSRKISLLAHHIRCLSSNSWLESAIIFASLPFALLFRCDDTLSRLAV